MDRLISLKAAIDALKGIEFCHYMEFGEYIGEDTREVRLIRAEKAHDALQNLPSAQPDPHYDEWCTDCKEYDQERHCCPRWNRVISQTVKEIKAQQRWIPCSERLPEYSGTYLVTLVDKDGQTWGDTCVWNSTFGGRWQDVFDGEYRDVSNVVAWMPLPQPYQGERREEP